MFNDIVISDELRISIEDIICMFTDKNIHGEVYIPNYCIKRYDANFKLLSNIQVKEEDKIHLHIYVPDEYFRVAFDLSEVISKGENISVDIFKSSNKLSSEDEGGIFDDF